MNEQRSFFPLYTTTQYTGNPAVASGGSLQPSVTVAATDASGASAKFSGVNENTYVQIQIANQTTSWAYVNFGQFGAVAAATVAASYPVAPGSVVVVSVDPEVTGASVILGTAAATGNVVFTRGEGI